MAFRQGSIPCVVDVYHRISVLLDQSKAGRWFLPLARGVRRFIDPRVHEKIARSAEGRAAFYPPSPSNFVEVFVPRGRELQPSLDEIHRITSPLNDADGALLRYLMEFAEANQELVTAEVFAELVQWNVARKRSRFLSGVDHAAKVLQGFSAGLAEPMAVRIERARPDLIEAFCSAPDDLKRVLRINLYLVPSKIPAVVKALTRQTELSLGRLEVARLSARLSSPQRFPTLILYAPPPYECDRRLWISDWKSLLVQELPEAALCEASADFADVWHHGCSVTEGFRLYKRYLQILGRLDAVYDRRGGYAYAL